MSKIHLTPVHPGEVLQDELEEIGLTKFLSPTLWVGNLILGFQGGV